MSSTLQIAQPNRNLTTEEVLSCKKRVDRNCIGNHQRRGELSSGYPVYYCPRNCPYWEAKK
jgi:hypothetical protein